MDILMSYSGLSVAFAIIAALFLYFIIGTKMHVVLKFVLIPIVIWFTLVLYFTPGKLMGWPTPGEPPDGSIILLPLIREPFGDNKGFIDIIAITRDDSKKSLIDQLDARNVFSYNEKNTERIYRLPYSKELHKKILEAQKKAKKVRGYMVYQRAKKGKKTDKKPGGHEDKSKIKVINPTTLIPKDGE